MKYLRCRWRAVYSTVSTAFGGCNSMKTIRWRNETKGDLIPEWGLSIWICHNGHEILLDTGASETFLQNAEKLGVQIQNVEAGVLSHAHHDHANGMAAFFEANAAAKFYLRAGCRENCYGEKDVLEYIGIRKGDLSRYQERIVYAEGDYVLYPDVFLIPHKTPNLEQIGKQAQMYTEQNGVLQPDDFAHEQSLVFRTEKGLVIFNSCSHSGADNIIREIAETFPNEKLYALIGGFHLYRSSDAEVRAFAERLRATGMERIYTGHCTGAQAMVILQEELGSRVQPFHTGMEIAF